MGEQHSIFELIYQALAGDPIVRGFIVLMLGLALVEGYSLYRGKRKDFKSYIVSLGVLGTFCGIFLGLGNFDTSDVIGSIPNLLEGLKLAFLTSITGMFCAVSLGIVETFLYSEDAKGADIDATPMDTIIRKLDKLNSLEAIEKNQQNFSNRFTQFISDHKAEQNSLQSILQTKFDEMQKTVADALQTMSKGATEEVIDALNKVISDFNNQLTEQFGENFKALNQAVLKLVEWQDQYMAHLEVAEAKLKAVEEMMEQTAKTITMVADTNADMQKMYDEVGKQITTYDKEVRTLHKELDSFAEVGDKAIAGFDVLNKGFTKILEDVEGLTDQISSGLNSQSETVEMLTDRLRTELPKSLGELEKTLATLTEKFGRDYEAFLTKCNQLLPR